MSYWYLLLLWPIIGFISSILCFLFLITKDHIVGYILFSLFSLILGPICLLFFIDSYKEENPKPKCYLNTRQASELYQLEIIDPNKNKLGKYDVVNF